MTQDTPLISVVVPVFNRSWQLKRALESLKDQTFKHFEIIICDDGSTEDIASVVNDFNACLNIKLIQIPNSGGPAKPRNLGVNAATGEWISFLDSDDWWDSNRLEIVVENLKNEFDFYYHTLRVVREKTTINSREKRSILGQSFTDDPFSFMLTKGNPIPTSATCVRRNLLLNHQGMSEIKELIALEDFDCWLRLAADGARFYFIDRCLGNYWIGSDAISNISTRQIYGQKILFDRISPKIAPALYKQALARQNYVLGTLLYRFGNPSSALKHLLLANSLKGLKLACKRVGLIIACSFSLLKKFLTPWKRK